MLSLFKSRLRAWIAGLASRVFPAAPAGAESEAGVLVRPERYLPVLDDIGEMPMVSCWRQRGEDDFHFKHRLAIHLQEQVLAREQFEQLLEQVLAVER